MQKKCQRKLQGVLQQAITKAGVVAMCRPVEIIRNKCWVLYNFVPFFLFHI